MSYYDLTIAVTNASIPTGPSWNNGLCMSDDGTILWALGANSGGVLWFINQYLLATPYDIRSATLTQSYNNPFGGSGPYYLYARTLYVSPDGSKFYIANAADFTVHEFSIQTPFNISTSKWVVAVGPSQGQTAMGLFFKHDGTKLYWLSGPTFNKIYQYTLSIPWDITTMVYDTLTLAGTFNNIYITLDGIKLYVNPVNNTTVQYTMSTPWNISTATADGVSANTAYATTFASTGINMYSGAFTASGTIYQYTNQYCPQSSSFLLI
jgi:hypothetical protein